MMSSLVLWSGVMLRVPSLVILVLLKHIIFGAYNCLIMPVEPPNKRHFGSRHFVLYREAGRTNGAMESVLYERLSSGGRVHYRRFHASVSHAQARYTVVCVCVCVSAATAAQGSMKCK